MGHVVVTAQDAIGKACVFQLFQFPGGVFKLIRLVEFVYNVAGVDHVFDAQPVLLIYNPIGDRIKVLHKLFGIILSVRNPGKGKVILLRNSGAIPDIIICHCVRRSRPGCHRLVFCASSLDQNGELAIGRQTLQIDNGRNDPPFSSQLSSGCQVLAWVRAYRRTGWL